MEMILRLCMDAQTVGADLICFPECYLQGYLFDHGEAADLALDLDSDEFARLLDRLAHLEPAVVLGLIEMNGGSLFNSAVVVRHGEILGAYRKMKLLPGESVFKEGGGYPTFEVGGVPFGINICNDLNFPEGARAVADQGARLLVCPCNNMMNRANAERWKYRHNEIRARRAAETGLWLISSDVTGEHDDRLSYGPTAVIAPDGAIVDQACLQKEGIIYHELELPKNPVRESGAPDTCSREPVVSTKGTG